MKVTLLGTGTPLFDLQRAGPSQVLDIDGQKILIDCGPASTFRLYASSVDPGEIDTLFFTHHHLDHNADFATLHYVTWMHGRKRMRIFGPVGTRDFVSAVLKIYEHDYSQRESTHRPGLTNPEVTELQSGSSLRVDDWQVSALETIHRPLNLAYRFTHGDRSVVFSGDTAYHEPLARFAKGAHVLVHEVFVAKPLELASEQERSARTRAVFDYLSASPASDAHKAYHSTAEGAGRIAEKAGVKKLVLSHILPLRDLESIKREASAVFSGPVVLGEDLMTIDVD